MNAEIAKYYTAVFREFSPYVIVSGQGEVTGYMIEFLRVLKSLDNINITIIPSKVHIWGLKNGSSWNGVLGMLQRNERNFSLNPLSLSQDRYNTFPSSHPFLNERMQILFGTNESNGNDIYSVVDKWIVVVLCGLALLIFMAGKLSSKYGKEKTELPPMFLLQCLLGTSPQGLKCEGVTRFLSVLWSLNCFVVLVFVSSEMTSEFSNKLEALPFDNIDDIFHFPHADPFLTKGSTTFSFIQKNALTSPSYAEVTKRADANPHTCYQKMGDIIKNSNIHAGIENRKKFIIASDAILWNVIKTRYAKTRTCKMKLSKPLVSSYRTLYFSTNISQTLIEIVNKRLRQLTEGGCYVELNPALKMESHPCQTVETSDAFVVINLKAFKAIFRVCILGFSASFIALFFEIYVNTLKVNMCTS